MIILDGKALSIKVLEDVKNRGGRHYLLNKIKTIYENI